jgi:hypothetical protein
MALADLARFVAADVLALVRRVFPEEEPPARLALLLEDVFDQNS